MAADARSGSVSGRPIAHHLKREDDNRLRNRTAPILREVLDGVC